MSLNLWIDGRVARLLKVRGEEMDLGKARDGVGGGGGVSRKGIFQNEEIQPKSLS